MRRLINKLPIAWLVLALMVAPLQAMALPVAMVANDDCTMMQAHQQHSPAMHPIDGHAKTQCGQCTNPCCDNGQCTESSCTSAHYLLSIPADSLAVYGNPLVSVHPDYHESTSSHAPNPPYRPPV